MIANYVDKILAGSCANGMIARYLKSQHIIALLLKVRAE
jgi:hypothetical protein